MTLRRGRSQVGRSQAVSLRIRIRVGSRSFRHRLHNHQPSEPSRMAGVYCKTVLRTVTFHSLVLYIWSYTPLSVRSWLAKTVRSFTYLNYIANNTSECSRFQESGLVRKKCNETVLKMLNLKVESEREVRSKTPPPVVQVQPIPSKQRER
jgi:hypothetical protein